MFSIFQHQPANLKSCWFYTNNIFRFTFGLYHSVNRGILVYAVTSQLDCCLGRRGGGLEVAGLAASIGLATLPTITHHPFMFKVSYSVGAENIHNAKIFWCLFCRLQHELKLSVQQTAWDWQDWPGRREGGSWKGGKKQTQLWRALRGTHRDLFRRSNLQHQMEG